MSDLKTLVGQLGQLSPDETKKITDFISAVSQPSNHRKGGFLDDQRGNKSSKRFWAFAFGWATVIQALVVSALVIVSLVVGKDNSGVVSLVPLVEYALSCTGVLTATCLGLTLPEWFASPNKG